MRKFRHQQNFSWALWWRRKEICCFPHFIRKKSKWLLSKRRCICDFKIQHRDVEIELLTTGFTLLLFIHSGNKGFWTVKIRKIEELMKMALEKTEIWEEDSDTVQTARWWFCKTTREERKESEAASFFNDLMQAVKEFRWFSDFERSKKEVLEDLMDVQNASLFWNGLKTKK